MLFLRGTQSTWRCRASSPPVYSRGMWGDLRFCVTAADCSRKLLAALRCHSFQELQSGMSADEGNMALHAPARTPPPGRVRVFPAPPADHSKV